LNNNQQQTKINQMADKAQTRQTTRTQLQEIAASSYWSETVVLHALQQIRRFKDRLHRRLETPIQILDASAHFENAHETVVQHVIDVVRQALNGRAADIFNAFSAARLP